MVSRFLIYGLIDPRDGCLRYVGKSTTGMRRPNAHCGQYAAKHDANSRKRAWIADLSAASLKPDILVIEELPDDAGQYDVEQFWIAYFRFVGCDLLNMTDGGPGWQGLRHTPEARRKIAESLVGKKHTPERRAKQSAAHYGKILGPYSEQHRAAISKARGARPFIDTTGRRFESVRKASRVLGILSGSICNVLKGRRQTTHGIGFRYLE